MIHITNKLPFPIQWQCVKAHQDDIKISGLAIYGPLPVLATFNALCKTLTTSAYNNPRLKRNSPFHMNTAKVSLTINSQLLQSPTR